MKNRKGIVFILVLGIGAAVAWWLWHSPPSSEDSPRGPSRVDVRHSGGLHHGAATPDQNMPPVPGVNLLASRPLEPKERWTASLSFYVMDSVGNLPVSGAKISVQGALALPPAWSNADGNVTFLQLPPGMYWYKVFHDTYAATAAARDSFFVLAAGEHREILVELQPACVAMGRVVDAASGEAVSGAEIYAERYEPIQPAITGADGTFQTPTGYLDQTQLYVKATGYSPQYVSKGCARGRAELGDIQLVKDWVLRGTVVDIDGEAIAGVTVRDFPLEPGAPPRANVIEVTTGSDGSFAMAGLPFTDENIMFYKEGYQSRTEHVNPGRNDITVIMPEECILQGRVTDGDGNGLEGATITALLQSGSTFAVSDATGDFSLTGLGGGMVMLLVSWGGEGQQSTQMVSVQCKEQKEPLIIEFSGGGDTTVSGVVKDEEGSPVAFAMVWLIQQDGGQGGALKHVSTMTGEDGTFSLAAPAQGDYGLAAIDMRTMRSGFASNLNGAQSNVVITLKTVHSGMEPPQSGTVRNADGSAVTGFTYCWSRDCPAMVPAEDDGTWRGRSGRDFYPLVVRAEDGRMGILNGGFHNPQPDDPNSAADTGTVVTLGPGAAVYGTLGEGFGEGFAWVRLSGYRVTLQRVAVSREFRFPLLPPGTYSISLVNRDGQRLDLPPVTVQDGVDVDLGTIDID